MLFFVGVTVCDGDYARNAARYVVLFSVWCGYSMFFAQCHARTISPSHTHNTLLYPRFASTITVDWQEEQSCSGGSFMCC